MSNPFDPSSPLGALLPSPHPAPYLDGLRQVGGGVTTRKSVDLTPKAKKTQSAELTAGLNARTRTRGKLGKALECLDQATLYSLDYFSASESASESPALLPSILEVSSSAAAKKVADALARMGESASDATLATVCQALRQDKGLAPSATKRAKGAKKRAVACPAAHSQVIPVPSEQTHVSTPPVNTSTVSPPVPAMPGVIEPSHPPPARSKVAAPPAKSQAVPPLPAMSQTEPSHPPPPARSKVAALPAKSQAVPPLPAMSQMEPSHPPPPARSKVAALPAKSQAVPPLPEMSHMEPAHPPPPPARSKVAAPPAKSQAVPPLPAMSQTEPSHPPPPARSKVAALPTKSQAIPPFPAMSQTARSLPPPLAGTRMAAPSANPQFMPPPLRLARSEVALPVNAEDVTSLPPPPRATGKAHFLSKLAPTMKFNSLRSVQRRQPSQPTPLGEGLGLADSTDRPSTPPQEDHDLEMGVVTPTARTSPDPDPETPTPLPSAVVQRRNPTNVTPLSFRSTKSTSGQPSTSDDDEMDLEMGIKANHAYGNAWSDSDSNSGSSRSAFSWRTQKNVSLPPADSTKAAPGLPSDADPFTDDPPVNEQPSLPEAKAAPRERLTSAADPFTDDPPVNDQPSLNEQPNLSEAPGNKQPSLSEAEAAPRGRLTKAAEDREQDVFGEVYQMFTDLGQEMKRPVRIVADRFMKAHFTKTTMKEHDWNRYEKWFAKAGKKHTEQFGVSGCRQCWHQFKQIPNHIELLDKLIEEQQLDEKPTIGSRNRDFERWCERLEKLVLEGSQQDFHAVAIAVGGLPLSDEPLARVIPPTSMPKFFEEQKLGLSKNAAIILMRRAAYNYTGDKHLPQLPHDLEDADLVVITEYELPSLLSLHRPGSNYQDDLKIVRIWFAILLHNAGIRCGVDKYHETGDESKIYLSWSELPLKLAEAGLQLCNYPPGSKLPTNGGNKGIASLRSNDVAAWVEAITSSDRRPCIQRLKNVTPSDMLEGRVAVVVDSAPPPNSKQVRGRRLFYPALVVEDGPLRITSPSKPTPSTSQTSQPNNLGAVLNAKDSSSSAIANPVSTGEPHQPDSDIEMPLADVIAKPAPKKRSRKKAIATKSSQSDAPPAQQKKSTKPPVKPRARRPTHHAVKCQCS